MPSLTADYGVAHARKYSDHSYYIVDTGVGVFLHLRRFHPYFAGCCRCRGDIADNSRPPRPVTDTGGTAPMIEDLFKSGIADDTHKNHRKAALYAILGDLLFIVLPLVVISIVDVSVGRSIFAIIESPELSFGSAVLFGQTIIKVVSGFAHSKPSGAEQPVFIIALIIVFGLVPSLVVLALLLSVNPIPHGLQLAQAAIFALGIMVFLLFGVNGHALSLRYGGRQLERQIDISTVKNIG